MLGVLAGRVTASRGARRGDRRSVRRAGRRRHRAGAARPRDAPAHRARHVPRRRTSRHRAGPERPHHRGGPTVRARPNRARQGVRRQQAIQDRPAARQAGPGGKNGRFTEVLSSPSAGQVTVQVGHTRTATMGALLERRHFAALDEQRRIRLTRAVRGADPAAPGRDALLHPADRRVRLGDWAGDRRLPPAAPPGRLAGARRPTIDDLLNGVGAFNVRYPKPRQACRGRPVAPGARADRRVARSSAIYPISSGKPSTPTVLGGFQVYSEGPRLPARRDVLLELLHRRLRDPRLQPGAGLSGQPRLHAACRSSTRSRSTTGCRSATGSTSTTSQLTRDARSGPRENRARYPSPSP